MLSITLQKIVMKTSDGSKTVTRFDATLKAIRNNGKTTKLTIVKSHGININLYTLIIKALKTGKTVLQKD